jgi:superfamily I DNA/RNA helicase
LIVLVAQLQEFRAIVRRAFGDQPDSIGRELDDSIISFCSILSNEQENRNRTIADADLASLIALSAMIADGFGRPDAPAHLYQIRRNTAVFIDEVQDFTEVEVLLMGMTVTSAYHQITLAGDRRQRLQQGGAENYGELFPFVRKSQQNPAVFLDFNFRQRRELAALSAGFRSLLQENQRITAGTHEITSIAAAYAFGSEQKMARFILQRILSVDAYATVAVITPSEPEARRWYDHLYDDLAAYHRPALLSHRDDLTRRNDIHFTEVREAKGLEFDVVIVPNLGSFDLDNVIGRNQLYVAISRPRHALLLGLHDEPTKSDQLQALFSSGLMRLTPLPEFPAD